MSETIAPERADREGDSQALPTDGSQEVSPWVIKTVLARDTAPKVVVEGIAADLTARIELGVKRYGKPLQTHNGRNATLDAYEETLDQLHYLGQARLEQPMNGKITLAYYVALGLAFDLKAMLV